MFEFRDAIQRKQALVEAIERAAIDSDPKINAMQQEVAKGRGEYMKSLLPAGNHLAPRSDQPGPPNGAMDLGSRAGWGQYTPDILAHLDRTSGANSVADAVVKAQSYLRMIDENVASGRYFFRGLSNIEYDLLSRWGRHCRDNGIAISQFDRASDEEMAELRRFRREFRWRRTWSDWSDWVRYAMRSRHRPDWWALMQHFDDDGSGTRLMDLTRSLNAALYFACVSWTGELRDNTDGVVYVFHERNMNARVQAHTVVDQDFEDQVPRRAGDMFDRNGMQVTRIYHPSQGAFNRRIRSQRGVFAWWPDFLTPLTQSLFYIRINKEAKLNILKELVAYGVDPRLIVAGPKGELAYESVCRTVGMNPTPY